MPLRILLFSAALAALPTPAAHGEISAKNRTISSSKQFVIFASDSRLRSGITIKAEDYKRFLLDLLKIRDDWKHTVILNLGAPPPVSKRPPKFQMGLYEADGGTMKIQVDVFDPAFLEQPEFDEVLIGAILLEFAYRKTPIKSGGAYEAPPDWIVAGLLENFRARSKEPKSSVFSSLLASGETPRLDDFFRAKLRNTDSTTRTLYGAQARAMIEALLDLPDGRRGLASYIHVPHRSPADTREILEYFPSLEKNREALGRKWLLAIARASAGNRVDLLDIRTTGTELAGILDVKALPDPKKPEVASMSGPYAFESIARTDSGRFILSQLSAQLLHLSLRAHPLYKPLVDEYLRIVNELIAKPKRRVDKRIAAAEQMRASLARHKSELESYLDWVEATKITTASEEFTHVISDLDEIEETPPRRDAISRHLDAITERGW